MGQGEDFVDAVVADRAYFRLLRVHAAAAVLRAERAGAAEVVELQLGDVRWHFIVGQHQAEHGDGAGQREVIALHFRGHHQVAEVIERVGHFVVGEGHGDGGRAFAVVGDDYQLVRPGGKCQGDSAVACIALLLRHGLDLRAVSVEDGDVQARAQFRDVGG